MSGEIVSISASEFDSKVKKPKHFIDVWYQGKKLVRRESVDAIRIKHNSIQNYIALLSQMHGVNEFKIDIVRPTGTSYRLVERVLVRKDEPEAIQTIDAAIPANITQPEIIPQKMENKMTDTQSSFYALQNELLRGHYETLKKDYDILKQKFDKQDDELREAKTQVHLNEADKRLAVLSGVAEVRNSGMDFVKDILKPENATGIAEMIRAVKGGTDPAGATPSIFKGMNATQQESLQAMADILKTQTPEETDAMIGVAIIASNDNTKTWFQRVKAEVENEIKKL